MWGISSEDSPGRATLNPSLIEQNERIIASSPPISLSLKVGESKCDAPAFFSPPKEVYMNTSFQPHTDTTLTG